MGGGRETDSHTDRQIEDQDMIHIIDTDDLSVTSTLDLSDFL